MITDMLKTIGTQTTCNNCQVQQSSRVRFPFKRMQSATFLKLTNPENVVI